MNVSQLIDSIFSQEYIVGNLIFCFEILEHVLQAVKVAYTIP